MILYFKQALQKQKARNLYISVIGKKLRENFPQNKLTHH